MTPAINTLLDLIAHAGWPPGPQEWAVCRVMDLIVQWAKEQGK